MKKKIVIITSKSLRHKYFRVFLSNQKGINVLKTVCEDGNKKLKKLKRNYRLKSNLLAKHIFDRDKSERDLFKPYLKKTRDRSNYINRKNGFSSSTSFLKLVKSLKPDLIIVYGSSIIKGEILNLYKKKILNLHLGLSPYYRGSGTNLFPFVNNEIQYVGATFMLLDRTIDNGRIIHQEQAKVFKNDNIHTIGNRLILEMFEVYKDLILNFNKVKIKNTKKNKTEVSRVYKRKDFNLSAIKKLRRNLKNKIIENYVKSKNKKKLPLIKQKWIN